MLGEVFEGLKNLRISGEKRSMSAKQIYLGRSK
jgi:hypothetical protein